MDDEESFLPNLASMLEVSLVEVAEQAISEGQAEKSDKAPQNEAIVENGFKFPTEEKEAEMLMQEEDEAVHSEPELEEQVQTSPSPLFEAVEGVPLQQVQESEFAHEELLDPKYQAAAPVSEEEEKTVYAKIFKDLECVSYMRLHCTVCDRHIGCGGDANFNMSFHKILQVLMCHECESFYGTGEFDVGEDGSEMFCRWCGQGGQVFCCSHCPSVFCKKCIRHNLGKKKVKEISESTEWTCYKCDARPLWQLRALCRALHNFIKEQSEEEKKISEESAAGRAGFNEQRCCKGDRLPYHRAGQPLRRLQLPMNLDEAKKKNDAVREAISDSILQKALSSIQEKSTENKPPHKDKTQCDTSNNSSVAFSSKIVPVDTRKLLEPSKLGDATSTGNKNTATPVYRKMTPKTYSRIAQKPQTPVTQEVINILSTPPTVPGTTPMVRFPESSVSNIHPTVNKIVLNPGNLIYTMPRAPMSVRLPPVQPPPLVVSASPSPPSKARRYYLLSSSGSNDPPKLVPITTTQNSFVNALSHIQVISPPKGQVKVISPTTANKNVQTHGNNQNAAADMDDDDDDVVEVFSNVETSEKLTCDWLFKAFRDIDETSRLLSSYVELLRQKFFSDVNGKGATAKDVRRFAGKFRYLLLKAAKKLNSDRELVAKEFSEWLNAEREKHGINLKNNSDTCKEDETAKTTEPEQKEPDLLLDMDCESDPEESSPHEDDADASSGKLKEDLIECSENLSENEADDDPFTDAEIIDTKRKLEVFKPFYTRTVRELVRDKYSCKLLFKVISEQIALSDGRCQKCSNNLHEEKKQHSDVSMQTEDPPTVNMKAEWSGAFTDFLATAQPEIALNSSTESADDAAGDPSTWSDGDTEEKIGSHKIKNCERVTTSDGCITDGHVNKKSQNKSLTSIVNGCNVKHKDNYSSLNGILTEKTRTEEGFSAAVSTRNKRRRKSESSNDDSPPRLSPQLFLKKKRTESPGMFNDSSNQTSSDAGSLVSCSVKVVSKVKLDYTDVNSKPSTSWATPPKIKNKKNRTNSLSNAASPKLDSCLKLPLIKLERLDVDLVKSAIEKNIIKPCTVSIVKLSRVE